MRIVVTGATGFLGGALSRRLKAIGHDVIALGRDKDKLAALAAKGIAAHQLDLANPVAAAPSIAAEALIHCAALSAPWGKPSAFHRANVIGTEGALNLARAAGAKRFVHISTPSVYFRFKDQVGVREDAELPAPINAYAETKRQAEELVLAVDDLDAIVLRPRGLYGPGDTTLLPRLIAAARKRALPFMNQGRAATDLTYIDDVADAACVAATIETPPALRIFNISGGEALNVCDVAERAAARAQCTVKWRTIPAPLVLAYARASEAACRLLPHYPEPTITAYGAALFAFTQTLNIDAAKAQLGWAPRVRFDEGLRRTFESAPA